MAYNEKQKEYTMNYMKEKLDEIKFRVPKGQKEVIREHAEQQGEKLTPFIVRAINETMERDNLKHELVTNIKEPEPAAEHSDSIPQRHETLDEKLERLRHTHTSQKE